ncbi:MAG: hypothetical protein D6677_02565 [Calditrichaeota bacterium]|nr:MAG: hypothetical protein D6677_02565 [Calditrichota bacterium]
MKSLLFIFILCATLLADTVLFKDGKKLIGQTLLISSRFITLETFDSQNGKLKDVSFPIQSIDLIRDETGVLLFKDNKKQVPDLSMYYIPYDGNWELLRMAITGRRDSIALKDGRSVIGRAVSVNRNNIFVLRPSPDKEGKEETIRILLDNVKSVNRMPVVRPGNVLPKKISLFPALLVNVGFNMTHADLSRFIGEYKARVTDDPDIYAYNLSDTNPGYYLSSIFLFNARWGMEMGVQMSALKGNSSMQMEWLAGKYFWGDSEAKGFWVMAGVGFISFNSLFSTNDYKYVIDARDVGPALGMGLDLGAIGDWSVSLGAHYFVFRDKEVKISFPIEQANNPRLNLSMFMLHIAFQMGGRL